MSRGTGNEEATQTLVQPLVSMPISGLVLRTQSAAIVASMLKWPELAMFNPVAATADSININTNTSFSASHTNNTYGALSPSMLGVSSSSFNSSSNANSPMQQQQAGGSVGFTPTGRSPYGGGRMSNSSSSSRSGNHNNNYSPMMKESELKQMQFTTPYSNSNSNNNYGSSPSPKRTTPMRAGTGIAASGGNNFSVGAGNTSPYRNNNNNNSSRSPLGRSTGDTASVFFPPSPSPSPPPSTFTPNNRTMHMSSVMTTMGNQGTNHNFELHEDRSSFGASGSSSSSSAAPGGGFSPEVLDVLLAFDSLQKQLVMLRPPKAVAHTCLMQRLLGMRTDVSSLADMCNKTANFQEGDRLRALCAVIDGALDADETETMPRTAAAAYSASSSLGFSATTTTTTNNSTTNNNALSALHVSQAVDASMNVVGGRGRKRLDHLTLLLTEVRQGIKDLQRLVVKARIQRDYTGAAALDEVAKDLTISVTYLEKCLAPFSFLDDDEFFEVKERVAREGPAFITADFIFQFSAMVPVPAGRQSANDSCAVGILSNNKFNSSTGSNHRGDEQLNNVLSVHTVGSLALISGCGAVLRYIRSKWPGLTALGENTQKADAELDSLMLAGGGKLDSTAAQGPINFNDVSELRSLGFDPTALKAAGFSDLDIMTGGFTAAQLKAAGFGADGLVSPQKSKSGAGFQFAGGMVDSSVLRAVLSEDEQQIASLRLLFAQTGGNNNNNNNNNRGGDGGGGGGWRATNGWQSLYDAQVNNAPLGYESGASAANRARAERYMLGSLLGVKYDAANSAVLRITLNDNQLSGFLPSEIGFLTHLTHLVLSDNALKGEIPESIGLLSNLDTLVLDGNAFTGEIPKSLKNLKNLSVLRLERNNLHGPIPAVLCALNRLRRLDLSFNNLSGPLPLRIGNMTSLQELILHHNQLSGPLPEAIGEKLISLTCLLLNNNRLCGAVPQSWGRLQKLTALQLQDNVAGGIAVDRLLLQRALPKCRIKL